MAALFEDLATLVFEIAGLHLLRSQKQHARFVIQLDAEFSIPFTPEFDRAFRQLRVILIRAVSRAHGFADVGGCGEWMRQRPRIDKNNFVPALLECDRGRHAVNPRADNDRNHASNSKMILPARLPCAAWATAALN